MNYMDQQPALHVACAVLEQRSGCGIFVPEDNFRLPMRGIFHQNGIITVSGPAGVGIELDWGGSAPNAYLGIYA